MAWVVKKNVESKSMLIVANTVPTTPPINSVFTDLGTDSVPPINSVFTDLGTDSVDYCNTKLST